MKYKYLLPFLALLVAANAFAQKAGKLYHEQYRPQIHFSPKSGWMNDPNGMVYYKGVYHLFYQHYPDGIVWGPMHWGHATSKDMIHWKEQKIALYPDKLGYIFSGSAVIDVNNTSGFGKNGKVPMVAIFTHHDPVGEKAGKDNFQNQSIAYSLDEGKTWTKYAGNPVLKNPGIKDFRDPKVYWYEPQHKWIMTLATKDRITFYSSPNLKTWKKESEFGEHLGAHGGVWECPDLFPMTLKGKQHWVLIVNINPGGPNGGSATQYFIGDFNGKTFTPMNENVKWADFGPDEYAGITWSNTGNRRIFLGWMSNWEYANQVPASTWRSTMTIPRELGLKEVNGEVYLTSTPAKELASIAIKSINVPTAILANGRDVASFIKMPSYYRLKLSAAKEDLFINLFNDAGESLVIGYNKKSDRYFIERDKSGKTDFNKNFSKLAYVPRFSGQETLDVDIVVDGTSVEMFADGGLSNLTSIFFAAKPYNHISIQTAKGSVVNKVSITPLKSIW
ncbi:glycoside hydrolase family 32 protein [Mucilaginibacter terrenus]|uniref:Glycoside hydrolase family 32 protein n=1 Tax=Mucilaginibacter terrenus TaxID=2482727 RepID=A0A3E2NN38_9SPHI|nr:glycoside hydrolase family 32 protein [Mucilaginibacter terrenus]RFZ82381.1 glycoside hydrolase family 32 protein [Mucilaginibacter terrenus]